MDENLYKTTSMKNIKILNIVSTTITNAFIKMRKYYYKQLYIYDLI